jgi:SnoaL-like protein
VATPDNPLREALIARDPEMARAAFADDVVVRSPIFSVEFDGVDEATDVMAAVFQTVGEMDYFYDERGADLHVFAWRTDVDGEPLEGVDIVRYDNAGKIAEVTIHMRPLRGIAAFLDKGGPILAENQSRGRALLMRIMGPPPSMAMRSVAGLGPKMLGLKRARKST